ncbi:hypothetical protein [Agromyces archimandritae]|uniref:Uncharacterized protein n=1 Tax=Agromyces archimandritae TaxID=2781962 RepID=A0A975FL81_9MICO|nr:hypothetical protein [Agromyces archimandritae]QTX03493.1 hypothetical protein G127AT_08975 [Agromyces archimandritae]
MTSTNHKAIVRAYMRDHVVKYTEALRALGYPSPMSEHQPAKHMLLNWDQYDYFPDAVGPAFATMAEAKAAAHEDGDVIVGGFFAHDVEGGALRWHSDPHGNASHRILDPIRGALWGNPIAWNDEPRVPNGWTRSPTVPDALGGHVRARPPQRRCR